MYSNMGELTWTALSPNVLHVSTVSFAANSSYATITSPASKTDPFHQGTTLNAPTIPLSTCAVAYLWAICHWHAPQEPLFILEGGHPFNHDSFIAMLHCCLEACGIALSLYSGHSFQCSTATWVATNGANSNTIQALGQWCSNCFCHYIDRSADNCATTSRVALYVNASTSICLDTPAWHDF